MTVTVRQIAELIHGELLGDADRPISNAKPLSDAGDGDITFVEDDKHLHAWHNSRASAAVVPLSVPVNGKPIIRVADPLMAFVSIVRMLRNKPAAAPKNRIHPTAVIHPSVTLGSDVEIGPMAVIGENSVLGSRVTLHPGACIGRNCRLGDDVTLHPHVVLYDDCLIGNRVTIHAQSVIGADGFGYRMTSGKYTKVPQLGTVEIEDDVEIGACTTIDRGTFGPTRIGQGTKIDNLIMIGHNCRIGRHNVMAGQVGIAGSTTTGDYVVMAGQVGIADHLIIGDRVTIGAQAGVHTNVPTGTRMIGTPAVPDRDFFRSVVNVQKIPEMRKTLKRIADQIGLDEHEGN